MAMRDAGVAIIPAGVPVALEIEAYFPIPKSWRKHKRAAAKHHVSRPDCDNICKAICDALSGVVYADDQQVCRVSVCKTYAGNAQTYVGVYIADALTRCCPHISGVCDGL